MKRIYLFLVLTVIVTISCSKTHHTPTDSPALTSPPDTLWSRIFDYGSDDMGCQVGVCADGGYIISGYTADTYTILTRTDSLGEYLWDKRLESYGTNVVLCLRVTDDGGFILSGISSAAPGPSWDGWIIKTDAMGNKEWETIIGGDENDYFKCVEETSDGGYIVTGQTDSYGGTPAELWLIKFDSQGNTLWQRIIDGYTFSSGESVVQTLDGGYIIAGILDHSEDSFFDAWLLKTDSEGNEIWSRTFGSSHVNDMGLHVCSTDDGGYVLAGESTPTGPSAEIWLRKVDAEGNLIWHEDLGEFTLCSMKPTQDGGFVVAGLIATATDYDVIIKKTDVNGNRQWEMILGGLEIDSGRDICQTPDGGYIVGVDTRSFGDDSNLWLIRLAGE